MSCILNLYIKLYIKYENFFTVEEKFFTEVEKFTQIVLKFGRLAPNFLFCYENYADLTIEYRVITHILIL